MHVWDSQAGNQSDADVVFDAADSGVTELGHIIENRVIQLSLLERIHDHHNIDLVTGYAVENIHYSPDQSRITLDNGHEISCQLSVADN